MAAQRQPPEYFHAMLDAIPDLVWLKDLDGVYLACNPPFERFFGATEAEIVGKTDHDFVDREQADRFRRMDNEVIAAGTSRVVEEQITLAEGGRQMRVETIKTPMYGSQGELIGVLGVARDITARKKVEQELAAKEGYQRALLDNFPFMVWLKDTQSRFLAVNAPFARAAGFSTASELVGKTDLDIWPADLAQAYRSDDQDVMRVARTKSVEEEVADQGIRRWFETYKTPVTDRDGELLGTVGFARDISERKNAEVRIRESEEYLRTMLDSIGDAVIATNLDGTIERMNPVAQKLTGWSIEEGLGRPLEEVFAIRCGRTGQKLPNPARRALQAGESVPLATDTLLVSKDGSSYQIADSAAPIRNDSGDVVGVVLVFRDVTEERQHAEDLVRMQKLESLGTIAGGIAHDFNNLLTAVFGNIELAGLSVAPGHEAQAMLGQAANALEQARHLTSQLLTFAKGGQPVLERVDTKRLVSEVVSFNLSGSRTRARFELPDDLWALNVDKGQLAQALTNLTLNAVHAMPEGGTLTVSGQNCPGTLGLLRGESGNSNRDCVGLTLRDEGSGILPEHLARIFDPYFTTNPQGHGLGLAIVHSVVTRHGGQVSVESRVGEGSTFSLLLPVGSEFGSAEIGGEDPARDPGAERSLRVLLMDDDSLVREVGTMMLERAGHTVSTVVDGDEMLAEYQAARVRRQPFDVVIMDLTIPGGKGGKEAIQGLLAIDPDAKAIVASGYASDPILANHREFGFAGKLTKPFRLHDLIAELARVRGSG